MRKKETEQVKGAQSQNHDKLENKVSEYVKEQMREIERGTVTCGTELLHSGLNLLLQLLVREEEAVLKLFLLFLQHDVTVDQHLLEPHPLLIQHIMHFLHLQRNRTQSAELNHD